MLIISSEQKDFMEMVDAFNRASNLSVRKVLYTELKRISRNLHNKSLYRYLNSIDERLYIDVREVQRLIGTFNLMPPKEEEIFAKVDDALSEMNPDKAVKCQVCKSANRDFMFSIRHGISWNKQEFMDMFPELDYVDAMKSEYPAFLLNYLIRPELQKFLDKTFPKKNQNFYVSVNTEATPYRRGVYNHYSLDVFFNFKDFDVLSDKELLKKVFDTIRKIQNLKIQVTF